MSVPAIAEVVNALKKPAFVEQIKSLLPPNVSVDRFTRTTIVALNQNPDILAGDRQTLYNAICRAAADGLLPDGKQGALVLFNQKVGNNFVKAVRFFPMVEGIVYLLAKAGIPTYAVSVYSKDEIEIWNDDDGQHVKHRPVVFGDRGEFVGVMAVARVGDRTYVETLNIEEIDKIRGASRSGDKGPWQVWYDRMAQKSVLHRLKKRLPIVDASLADSLRDPEEDADVVAPPAPTETPAEAETPRRRPRALEAVVEAAPAVVEPTPAEDVADEDLF